ncbi:MAG: phage tail protein [Myxococcota bacterium]|nr:phage tail protein [Myxococcota bacterium]
MENTDLDPEGSFIFCLELQEIEVAHFTECSGLKTSTTVFEIQEGGVNHMLHKMPGQSTWDNIVLRYGVTSSVDLVEWRSEVMDDSKTLEDSLRNGAIVVKNNRMDVVRRYDFRNAWPVSWEGPQLTADASEVAVEVLEIAHHGIVISTGS